MIMCYRGYIVYSSPDLPVIDQWAGQDYSAYYVVYFDDPVFNVTGDKPVWTADLTLAGIKKRIDRNILLETPYKTNPEGTQCTPTPISISEVNAYWSEITAWVSWVQNTPGKVNIIIDSVVWKTSYDGAAGINSLPIGQSPAINDTLDHTVCIEVF